MTAAPSPPSAPPLARNGGKAHTFAILPGSPGPYVDETAMKNIRNIGIIAHIDLLRRIKLVELARNNVARHESILAQARDRASMGTASSLPTV